MLGIVALILGNYSFYVSKKLYIKLNEVVKIANKVGAIAIQNYGVLESIPNLEDIL